MQAKIPPDYALYLVTDRSVIGERNLLDCIRDAVSGGVTVVQLREKDLTSRQFYELGLQVQAITREHNVPLIINDRLAIALAIGACGVHLGQTDLPASVARRLLGPQKLLGVSVNNSQEAMRAEREGADYVGAGAVFPTSTKHNVRLLGLEGLTNIKRTVHIPVLAIGGINDSNVSDVKGTDVDGICVVSAILSKQDITSAARELRAAWQRKDESK
ncbi:MAG: thiamine phosphate synthase [Bacillota bacterium]|nr:thiamine phosphate synthase [Bacillota bacterium]